MNFQGFERGERRKGGETADLARGCALNTPFGKGKERGKRKKKGRPHPIVVEKKRDGELS